MLGLRQKLIVGFGGLVLLLLVTGTLSLYLLKHYSDTVDRVFRENYDSVVYGQSMKDALDRLDGMARVAVIDGIVVDPKQQATVIGVFDRNLQFEAGNITVPGEGELVAALRLQWQKYLDEIRGFDDAPAATWRERYRARTFPVNQVVKAMAQQVIDLNLQNISSADGEIRRSATGATRAMYVLLGAGITAGGVFLGVFVRSILIPLRTLTVSAREIERGNLDLVVAVPTHDEVGQLADAFNSMAGKLRENRRSDRLKIVRAQRTTQLALDSLSDAIAIISADGRIDLANHTAQRLFRLRSGLSLDAVDAPRLLEIYRMTIASGMPFHPKGFESAIQVFDGEERFFLPHALPILDGAQSIGVTLVLADISGLRRLDEMKSNLLAVVSHELKTPLTGIRMSTHLLLDERTGPLTSKQAELVLAARDDGDRLNTIVESLLDISRIESGRGLMDLLPVAPRQLVDDAMALITAAYRDKGVALEVEMPADLQLVSVDAVRIAHVFANLLGNALKYTPSGGHVLISAKDQEHEVEFRVEDSGAGIPAEHRDRIFERFYRVPGQAQTGAGLGLAIAKEIVLAHGGQLWLADQRGGGATFCFTLPGSAQPSGISTG